MLLDGWPSTQDNCGSTQYMLHTPAGSTTTTGRVTGRKTGPCCYWPALPPAEWQHGAEAACAGLQSATILGGLAKQQHGTNMTEHERVVW
jgi:hypothetical protein